MPTANPIATPAGLHRLDLLSLLPGLVLCMLVTLAAEALEWLETAVFGRAYLEALVLAIILGMIGRMLLGSGERWRRGVEFSAKTLLELAVVLLGASVSPAVIAGAGAPFVGAVAALVLAAIGTSFAIGRLLGLDRRLAILVACGNAICGNSAIAAVAPVIGAGARAVGSSIAFTAVLGVAVVLLLPALVPLLGLGPRQYGVFAGLTVYAVPQVVAATAPVSALSLQVATVTKLLRVLMLGPVIFALAVLTRQAGPARPKLGQLLPWFILGFLALMGLRSVDVIPAALLGPMGQLATWLTVVSMAGLGLSVDVGAEAQNGGRVIAAATLSLLGLAGLALIVIRGLGIV